MHPSRQLYTHLSVCGRTPYGIIFIRWAHTGQSDIIRAVASLSLSHRLLDPLHLEWVDLFLFFLPPLIIFSPIGKVPFPSPRCRSAAQRERERDWSGGDLHNSLAAGSIMVMIAHILRVWQLGRERLSKLFHTHTSEADGNTRRHMSSPYCFLI